MDGNNLNINLLDMHGVAKKLACSRSTIYELLNPKSDHFDPAFPRPRMLFAGKKNIFIESELNAWIADQIAKCDCDGYPKSSAALAAPTTKAASCLAVSIAAAPSNGVDEK